MYQIESKDEYGTWTTDTITRDGESNRFETEAAAWALVEQLREIGPEWGDAEYRVVEVDD